MNNTKFLFVKILLFIILFTSFYSINIYASSSVEKFDDKLKDSSFNSKKENDKNTIYKIDYNSYRSIKSFNKRPRFLIMHYTAGNFKSSIDALTGNYVSSHYLVPDLNDITYFQSGFNDMRIFNLVSEDERAWHAGISKWSNRVNLNDSSIGIEIINQPKYDEDGVIHFEPFNSEQIKAVISLSKNILQRYPDISPVNVLGHSDISPGRKIDPGPLFPWKKLYDEGIGAWYDEDTKQKYINKFSNSLPSQEEVLKKLNKYGYDISIAINDNINDNINDKNTENNNINKNISEEGYKNIIKTFQMHFRPSNYDGIDDIETIAIIYSLVEKYFN